MRHFSLYRYSLPFNSGLILRQQRLTERCGVFCHLVEGKKSGWGEIAPLTGFSRESLDAAEQQAREWLTQWQAGQENSLEPLFPSVAFGLSVALHELHSAPLIPTTFRSVALCSDAENATIERLKAQHCTLAKLKVGRFSPEQDTQNVKRLLAEIPDLTLRLDANRAWDLHSAEQFALPLKKAEKQRIQFIEEPCQTPEISLKFAKNQQIPIAWDETAQAPNFVLHSEIGLKAIVIKPTLIGSLEKCLVLIQQAKKLQMETVISSSIESSLALSQLAALAENYTPETPAGLDTLSLMQQQLIRPFPHSDLSLFGLDSPFIQQI